MKTTRDSANFDRFEVVILPFPFTDKLATKRRPVVVLSSSEFVRSCGCAVTLMITGAKNSRWPLDTTIQDLDEAGLPLPCIIRMKFFTADVSLIAKSIGHLSKRDTHALKQNLQMLFGL